MPVGEALRLARLRRGWTQAQLADAAGLRVETIARIERGHVARPAAETLEKLSAALSVTVEYWRQEEPGADAYTRLGDVSRCFLNLTVLDQVRVVDLCQRLSLPLVEQEERAA